MGLFSVCALREKSSGVSSSYKDTSPTEFGPSHVTFLYLNHLRKDPISKYVRLEVRASSYGSGEGRHGSGHNTRVEKLGSSQSKMVQ